MRPGASSSNSAGVSATTAKKVVAYHDEFNADTLPLDGDFDGENVFIGTALRHGCTNDVRYELVSIYYNQYTY